MDVMVIVLCFVFLYFVCKVDITCCVISLQFFTPPPLTWTQIRKSSSRRMFGGEFTYYLLYPVFLDRSGLRYSAGYLERSHLQQACGFREINEERKDHDDCHSRFNTLSSCWMKLANGVWWTVATNIYWTFKTIFPAGWRLSFPKSKCIQVTGHIFTTVYCTTCKCIASVPIRPTALAFALPTSRLELRLSNPA